MLIQQYDSRWKTQYELVVGAISRVTRGLDVRFEHVGSTSVPGLGSKPILDIDIVYIGDETFRDLTGRLAQIGYYHNGNQGVPGREAFKRNPNSPKHGVLDTIRHHLYACSADSAELARHIGFRDFLRENEWARIEYEELKQAIASQAYQDHKTYAAIKEQSARGFIVKILALAGAPGYG